MEHKEHCLNLGKLIAMLHNLEFALRGFLCKRNLDKEPAVDLKSVHEGDWIEINSFTNYDTLCELIGKFNRAVEDSNPNLVIDTSVVNLRDALAHGRIAGEAPSCPLTLLKFGRPKKEKLQVLAEAVMNLAWFKDNLTLVHKQLIKVVNASNSLGMKIMEWV